MATGKLRDFAGKLSGPLPRHRNYVAAPIALADREGALEDDEHSRRGLAYGEQPLALGIVLDRAEAFHALDLGLGEHREELMPPA